MLASPSPKFVSAVNYAPHGGITTLYMGNGATETTNYNPRLQPELMQAAKSGAMLLSLDLAYVISGDNNGNVLNQGISHPAVGTESAFSATHVLHL